MEKLALLFPGQGSQYVGMGKNLYERFSVAKQVFEEADDALGFDLKRLCFSGSIDELTKTENAQPAILAVSVAAFRVFMQEIGFEPSFLAGHSLGEFSALTCAGGIAFADCVRLVRRRGELMQTAAPLGVGAMAAISGISQDIIEEECKNLSGAKQIVVISNYNSRDQTVVSGHKPIVEEVGKRLEAKGASVVFLKVSAPFHSPLMQTIAKKFRTELRKYTYSALKVPVVSNVTALPYNSQTEIANMLQEQLMKPVRWQETVEYLSSQGVTTAIELGPRNLLTNLVKKSGTMIMPYSYDRDDDLNVIKKLLTLKDQVQADLSKLVIKCLTTAVCTRNRNWDNEEFQRGVVEPYRAVQKMQADLEERQETPTIDQSREALMMLKQVFDTKRVPLEEQRIKFSRILEETGCEAIFSEFMAV